VISTLRPAERNVYILAFDVASFVEAFAERGHNVRGLAGRSGAEEPDDRHRSLLRTCRKRPCRRAAEKADELSPPQVEHQAAPCPGFHRWSVYRTLTPLRRARQVLGVGLNCSESTLWA